MRALDRRLIKLLGYEELQKYAEQDEDPTPCAACGSVPTTYRRLVPYKALREQGFLDEWIKDERFHTHLCRLCFLLWSGNNTIWTREYRKRHGLKNYTEAKQQREGEYLRLIEALQEKIRSMEKAKTDYAEMISYVRIDAEAPYPQAQGTVSYINASNLRKDKHIIVALIHNL